MTLSLFEQIAFDCEIAHSEQRLEEVEFVAVIGSGTFNTYFGVLKRSGFISENGDGVSITQEGMNFIGSDFPPPPTTTEELQALWRSSLRSGEARMLDELVKRYPNGLSRQELAYHSGFE